MWFNSYIFIAFFVVVYFSYINLRHRGQNGLLLVASYVFYGMWDPRFLGLILLSTVVDYFCGLSLQNSNNQKVRKAILWLSISVNLGVLGFFKYFDFFADNLQVLFNALGMNLDPITLNIILPVGISFYTFQTLSYTIDLYFRRGNATKNFFDFALFVSFFPQLVAGPIERATRLLPQIEKQRDITRAHVREGLYLIVQGFFKKIVIADTMAPFVDSVFNSPGEPHGGMVVLATYAFFFQIYGSFSGYTDIARGISKLMGFDLCVNFNMPFLAKNPSDFWRRWHISLSTWLRDYLYISLGGNRKGKLRTYMNLMTTMLLGGLWYGAAWNFIAWGFYHGAILAVHRVVSPDIREFQEDGMFTHWFKVFMMFQFTCIGWFLFRINSFSDIPILWNSFWDHSMTTAILTPEIVFVLVVGAFLKLLKDVSDNIRLVDVSSFKSLNRIDVVVMFCMFSLILLFGRSETNEFIYFQF